MKDRGVRLGGRKRGIRRRGKNGENGESKNRSKIKIKRDEGSRREVCLLANKVRERKEGGEEGQ